MYDGVRVPVSQLLGVGFKKRFLTRFCVPLFGTGFNNAPGSERIPHGSVLRSSSSSADAALETSSVEYSTGNYRLKYILSDQVCVHPDAFHRSVPQDGPYPIRNLWTDRDFHHSIL